MFINEDRIVVSDQGEGGPDQVVGVPIVTSGCSVRRRTTSVLQGGHLKKSSVLKPVPGEVDQHLKHEEDDTLPSLSVPPSVFGKTFHIRPKGRMKKFDNFITSVDYNFALFVR